LPGLNSSQKFFGSVHFLSLEIENRPNKFYQKFDINKIKSVFIQSKERYEYLFGDAKLQTFIVQNAPVFSESYIKHYPRDRFIYGGAMHRWLGVMECIEFFNQYPEFKLVLKGGGDKKTIRLIHSTYEKLIKSERIKIDQSYLPSDKFLDFLSTFRIGFCFYSWNLIESNFNYQTAPSGKLFMYLAAGTPVIACNIPGFQLVNEFRSGVLINDYKPETILAAVRKIESNYDAYSKACYEAARHYSFDKHVAPYIKFLNEMPG